MRHAKQREGAGDKSGVKCSAAWRCGGEKNRKVKKAKVRKETKEKALI